MPIFWRVFTINGCWILSKAFSAPIDIVICFLSFNLLIKCTTLIDLRILKNPCILGINPTWSWCMDIWCVAELCLLKFCWGFLQLCSSVILACSFLFLCCLCLVLVSGWETIIIFLLKYYQHWLWELLCTSDVPHYFLSISLHFGVKRFIFLAPAPELTISPRDFGFFYWRMVSRDHILSAKCAHCSLGKV